MSYFEELIKFIQQSNKVKDLKISYYKKEYLGLKIKVSFGQGGFARVPWIAFLSENDSVSNGIYPVYLYFKDKNILILSYGISETNIPKRDWNLINKETISNYFKNNNLGKPDRYGNSYVFKVYDITKLDQNTIDSDLDKIIETYKNLQPMISEHESLDIEDFTIALSESGLKFQLDLILRYTSALCTKPFVILTGLAGSGKTKLAQAFAKWICEKDAQYLIVPVGADWTNREPLLGYPNALSDGAYVKPENGTLDLILNSIADPSRPYFLILDEMNLSHVERYFADFLSAMESGGEISLHAEGEQWYKETVPAKIKLPKNLFIVGTVNIDETTYMFSPKVLDRANVIEFRVTYAEMEAYLQEHEPLKLEALQGKGVSMAQDFVQIAQDKTLQTDKEIRAEVNATLLRFFKDLKEAGAEFGYRSASEILRFVAVVNKIDQSWTADEIMDAAIMQKLLPKVHGSRRKLDPILKKLALLCLKDDNTAKIDEVLTGQFPEGEVKYPISLEKIGRMYRSLLENGFTSYAEA